MLQADDYALEFPSGITQIFLVDGDVAEILDQNTGRNVGVSSTLFGSAHGYNTTLGDQITSPRYTVNLDWVGGRIVSIDYVTTGASPQTITTTIGYASGGSTIISLGKSSSGTAIPDFSYQLIGPGAILNNGIEADRSGTVASGQVTIATTVTGIAGSSGESWTFNSDGMVTGDTVTLTEPDGTSSSAATAYTYANTGSTALLAKWRGTVGPGPADHAPRQIVGEI